MTLTVRNTERSVSAALIAAHNQRQVDAISTFYHLTQFETMGGDFDNPTVTRPTAPAAVTVDTTGWALIQTIIPQIASHFADLTAHDTVASTASTYTAGDVTDTATACLVLNDIKAQWNTHIAQAGAHYTNDVANTVTNADATDDATMQVLLNETILDMYAHWISAPVGTAIAVVSP